MTIQRFAYKALDARGKPMNGFMDAQSPDEVGAWLADRRLHRLLQSDSIEDDPMERFRAGTIVPDEGTTLLVDYGAPQGGIAQHHAGHAVYTRKQWLLFHAEEVVRRLYQAEARQVA